MRRIRGCLEVVAIIALIACLSTAFNAQGAWLSHPPERPVVLSSPIPTYYTHLGKVSLVLENVEPEEFLWLRLWLVNPTSRPITFDGLDVEAPNYRTQCWLDGSWFEDSFGVGCGLGVRECTVGPGEASLILAVASLEELPLRIGINYRLGSAGPKNQTVWSEKISKVDAGK